MDRKQLHRRWASGGYLLNWFCNTNAQQGLDDRTSAPILLILLILSKKNSVIPLFRQNSATFLRADPYHPRSFSLAS